MRFLLLAALAPLLTACLPASGPDSSDILAVARQPSPQFDVVALNTAVAESLAANEFESFTSSFESRGSAPDLRIGVGDTVVVTIFEAASGGLFSGDAASLGGGTKSVNLPPQPVARNGMITVPYVGQVRAQGRTPAEVQTQIESALRDKAIEPQVLVTVTNGSSTFVTVTGDVANPGRVPLSLDGDRILDLIATSGGSRAAAYSTLVQLTRGSRTATVSLSRIVNDPSQNIFLQPDDQIYVLTDPKVYSVFGAASQNSTYPFETDKLTLAEAVGRASGLSDSRADARGVFIFRYERPQTYAMLNSKRRAPAPSSGGIPVIYKLDLKEPTGYFSAQKFMMRDNDIIYISNAPATDLQKFLGIIGSGVGVTRSTTSFVDAQAN